VYRRVTCFSFLTNLTIFGKGHPSAGFGLCQLYHQTKNPTRRRLKFWNDASKVEFEIYLDVSGNILFRMPINGIMAVRNIFALSVRGTDERIIAVSYVKFCTDAHH
jgi:hypothetical protein